MGDHPSVELREQTCEACGESFGCGAETGGCWCNEVTLDAATLARLRDEFARCLCPRCLIARAGAKPRPGVPPHPRARA